MTAPESGPTNDSNGFRQVRARLIPVGGTFFRVRCEGSQDGTNWYMLLEVPFSAAWPTRSQRKPHLGTGGDDEAR